MKRIAVPALLGTIAVALAADMVETAIRALQTDPSLKDPMTVFQIVKKHYARYTPEMVERVCGCSKETFLKVAANAAE